MNEEVMSELIRLKLVNKPKASFRSRFVGDVCVVSSMSGRGVKYMYGWLYQDSVAKAQNKDNKKNGGNRKGGNRNRGR